jgi:hypothetical protein
MTSKYETCYTYKRGVVKTREKGEKYYSLWVKGKNVLEGKKVINSYAENKKVYKYQVEGGEWFELTGYNIEYID